MSARPGDRVVPAILLSLLAVLLFDLMGLVIKHLSTHTARRNCRRGATSSGLSPPDRACLHAPLARCGTPLAMRQWHIPLIRGVAVALAQLCFYLALGRLAFATAATISYSNALFIVALSVPILGERVGLFRWSAALIGFAGVVLVMGPGRDGFSLDALLPLAAAMLYAVAGVTSRLLDEDVPSALVNLHSTSIAAIGALALALALTGGFTPVASTADLGWIVAMGAFGGTAVLCLVVAYRMTEPSNLAPFSYFGIPMALLLGWIFFGEAPIDDLFPGAILIVAGGLMIVWRERRLNRGLSR
jgi:drug/metabolite transporter (DMT)-like permease